MFECKQPFNISLLKVIFFQMIVSCQLSFSSFNFLSRCHLSEPLLRKCFFYQIALTLWHIWESVQNVVCIGRIIIWTYYSNSIYVLHFDNKLVKFNSQINIKLQTPPGRDEILMVRYLSSFYKGWYYECQACLRICSHVIKFRHVM